MSLLERKLAQERLDEMLEHRKRKQRDSRLADFLREIEGTEAVKPLPPPDPEAEEGMNDKRSGWAMGALMEYAQQTGSELENLLADFLGDLGHWCDRHGLKLADEYERAREMYAEETEGQGKQFEESEEA